MAPTYNPEQGGEWPPISRQRGRKQHREKGDLDTAPAQPPCQMIPVRTGPLGQEPPSTRNQSLRSRSHSSSAPHPGQTWSYESESEESGSSYPQRAEPDPGRRRTQIIVPDTSAKALASILAHLSVEAEGAEYKRKAKAQRRYSESPKARDPAKPAPTGGHPGEGREKERKRTRANQRENHGL